MCTTCYCYHCGAYILVKRRQEELQTVCKHFLSKAAPDTVSVTTVDRLGLDLRVKVRDLTDELRIGFRQPVSEHTPSPLQPRRPPVICTRNLALLYFPTCYFDDVKICGYIRSGRLQFGRAPRTQGFDPVPVPVCALCAANLFLVKGTCRNIVRVMRARGLVLVVPRVCFIRTQNEYICVKRDVP